MITNHGMHQWKVIPGLPDTGGQNIFVNQFSHAMVQHGFKVSIVNRGGYVHPITGEWQRGVSYKDKHQRILYLEDSRKEFVRKEDMHERIPEIVQSLKTWLDSEGTRIDLLISHYWDAGLIGHYYKAKLKSTVKHIWVPHSLGALKKARITSDKWKQLRIDERIAAENEFIQHLDGIASTSSAITESLKKDYGFSGTLLFLPPCVDMKRYHPRRIPSAHDIWTFLSQHSGVSMEEVRRCKIITEISRTDITKRKDVLIKAFAELHRRVPESLLVVSIDDNRKDLAGDLKKLIHTCGIEKHTAVVGSIWDILPILYAVTDIYCTPSVMEGFGMSAQEAAATEVAVVATDRVPFVQEYLMGGNVREIRYDEPNARSIKQGDGGIQVPVDDVRGFTYALELLLTDDSLRRKMGKNAYRITIPYFTWDNMVRVFLNSLGF